MANVIIKKDFTGDTSDVIKVSSDSGGVVKSTTSGDPAGTISCLLYTSDAADE